MDSRQNHQYRSYKGARSSVATTYMMMHQQQTKACVDALRARFIHSDGTVVRKRLVDLFPILETLIDDSDPDTEVPQIHHAYQTGEALKAYCQPHNSKALREDIVIADLFEHEWAGIPEPIRKQYPKLLHELYPEINDWSWLPLAGFIHDLGKVLASAQWGALPQWQVVGDTFPINAPFADSNIFYGEGFYQANQDIFNQTNTAKTFGAYQKHCGFNNVMMSFGHDEYMFLILNNTIHHLPPHALYVIRFHSFYPWHTPRQGERGYTELANEHDWHLLPLLKAFQRSDLYSKTAALPNAAQLEAEYAALIKTFIPGRVQTRYDLRPAQLKMTHLEQTVMPSFCKS
jgi:inositol oxygenase